MPVRAAFQRLAASSVVRPALTSSKSAAAAVEAVDGVALAAIRLLDRCGEVVPLHVP
jgi:hypothetical protein